MEVVARPAGPHDVGALLDLEHEARAGLQDQRGGPEWIAGVPPTDADTWLGRVADPAWRVLVGALDDVIVAYAAAHRRGDIATVHHLFVHLGARDVGIGEALIEDLLDWATRSGASALEATALPGDRQTKNLFERFGMKARAITVSRRLG